MPIGGISHAAGDMGHGRERRVHDDDGGRVGRREMIVDLGRVETRDGDGREESGEQIGAGVGQLVEEKFAAADLGEDCEQPGAGRRLKHEVARRNGGRGHGGEPKRRRRRELLQCLTFLGAARVRRQEAGDFRDGGKPCSRRSGFAEKRLAVFLKEQHGRRFAGVVGRLPGPCAGRVRCAERRFHRAAQRCGVDAFAALEVGQKTQGRAERGDLCCRNGNDRRGCGGVGRR